MKEDRNEFVGYLPICPFGTEHPDMLIGIQVRYEAEDTAPATASEFAMNTETWD